MQKAPGAPVPAGKDGKGAGKKGNAAAAVAAAVGAVPAAPPKPKDGEAEEKAVPDYAPAKPRLLPIVDPSSGKPIDTIGMNFAPRKPSNPLQIINPSSGEAITPGTNESK